MAIAMCKFSKLFRGRMPPDPTKAVSISQFASKCTYQKEEHLKKCRKLLSLSWNIFSIHLQSAYLRPFPDLMSLHSVNEKISNLHHTRGISPKRVTSGGAHLRGIIALSTETSQRWRIVADSVWFDPPGNRAQSLPRRQRCVSPLHQLTGCI